MAPIQIPLPGGFYQSRSVIANAQRCVNMYPERNPEGSATAFTDYLTPGLTLLRAAGDPNGPAAGTARGAYLASNGNLYVVVGQTLYFVDPTWKYFTLGQLTTIANTPISMQDNGTQLVLVDGSPLGYLIDLVTNVMTSYADPNFLGADRVDYLDTFLTFNRPGTRQFYCTLSNVTTIDPTYIASKTGYPDNIATQIVNHREIWLLGTQKSTEIWYDAGGSQFPFQIEPGVYIEQGCAAKYSVARHDLEVFWLGVNADGKAMVFKGSNYRAQRISTYAIAEEISQYDVISDAIGMVYQQLDHIFYVLTFPTANRTWVYDIGENLWHERTYTDSNGNENRIRANFMIGAYGKILCGDWENGSLYHLDPNANTDNGAPIVRRQSFPHLVNNAVRNTYSRFIADMECGTALDADYLINLRYSDDRGVTWSTPLQQSLGAAGEYLKWPTWPGSLGMSRDKVFELFWSSPVKTALNGAFVNVVSAAT